MICNQANSLITQGFSCSFLTSFNTICKVEQTDVSLCGFCCSCIGWVGAKRCTCSAQLLTSRAVMRLASTGHSDCFASCLLLGKPTWAVFPREAGWC